MPVSVGGQVAKAAQSRPAAEQVGARRKSSTDIASHAVTMILTRDPIHRSETDEGCTLTSEQREGSPGPARLAIPIWSAEEGTMVALT